MRFRRIVCFLMGTWIGVSAMFALDVYRKFDAIDVVLKSPPEQEGEMFKLLGTDKARMLLRYTAGAETSSTFEVWENIQFALGLLIALVLFVASSTRVLSVAPLVMTVLVMFLHFKITPELAWLGRSLEFTRSAEDFVARDQFWKLHRIYAILEILKCLLGLGLTVFLVMQRGAKVARRRHDHGSEWPASVSQHGAPR